MDSISFNGKQESHSVVVRSLFEMYIGEWPMTRDSKYADTDWMQKLLMLQESIRREMRASYDRYLRGQATIGVSKECQGHAILLGKIIAAERRYQASLDVVKHVSSDSGEVWYQAKDRA